MSKKFVCLAAVGLVLAIAGSAGAQVGKGKILAEWWLNIGSGTTVADLTGNAAYPNKPTGAMWLDNWHFYPGSNDWNDNYGDRERAFLTPPADGDYTFYIASDDASELWLSTDDNPANAKKIAFVAGWTNAGEWQKEAANQKSAPITLKASGKYFIQSFHKEGGGGDFVEVGWTGPVIGNTITILDGKYCTAFIRDPEPLFKASKPDPATGAVEITSPLFQWTPGATAVMHEVYMGTNPTPGPAEFMGPWPTAMYFHIPGLTPGAKYYWRVDEVDAAGTKTTGDVWNFTVQPLEAHNPSPYDGALWRSLKTTVSWAAGQGAVSHKIFGSEDKAAVAAGASGALLATQAETKLDASALLQAGKTYYWRVDEVDSTGKVTPGPVWSFSTVDPAGGAVAEYWNNINLQPNNAIALAGKPAVVTTVPSVDFSWPDGTVKGTNSPDPAINTNYFGVRYTAQLNIPVSGTYKLYVASDDGGRLFLDGVQVAGSWVNRSETENATGNLDLVAGKKYVVVMEMYDATGGSAARLRWSGPGIAKEIIPAGALKIPQFAVSPLPRENETDVADNTVMTFTPAPKAVVHTMYFGTDKAKVTAGDASVALPPTDQTTYAPKLAWNTTYYWRVDEMAADGTTTAGSVWSFTTANFVVVQPGAVTGLTLQKTLNYSNTLDPFISQLAYDVTGDLTRGGVTDLALRFQGQAAAQGGFSFDAATGTYSVGGAGTDIWGTTDQFTYAYKALEGDGTMVLRVTGDDKKGANAWSKGGIMIRQSLANNAAYAIMSLTGDTGKADGGNGAAFQWRPSAGASAAAGPNPATWIKPPYFVKLVRKGNDFSGFMSETGDPNTWTQLGTTQTITMTDPVFIGPAVSSHLAGTMRTWTFDSVSTTGNVVPAGPFAAWEIINTAQNDPAPLYVAIEDQAGKVAAVTNANPAAVNTTVMDLWRIPMSAFKDVDLTNAAKLYIGVGDGKPDGSGVMNFADIRIVKPVLAPAAGAVDVTVKGDALKGFPEYANSWPAAEVPANAIDDSITTKYLNFANSGGTGGKTTMPAGFCVTPSMGSTVVTGLTLTTANDAAERDPVAWEVWGSNTSIDGPWEFIAKGAAGDFTRPLDWPRRWKNVTPIGFLNILPYLHYKVSFTAVKRPANANSMQIAEVEILGVPDPTAQLVKVNFQSNSQGDKVVPEGYLPDYGLPFADQGNGYSYGWSRNISADARDRNSKNSPDQRYDTFVHLQKGDPAVWEIVVPNGKYQVYLVGGDPDNTDQTNSFDVEGVIVPDADGQGDRWDTYLVNVTVADGRLTIKPALGATPPASNSKISFVVINAQ